MSDPTIDAIRQSVPDDRTTTHWAGCEVSHRWCAIRYLLDHLTVAEQARHQAEQERDELQRQLEQYRAERTRLPMCPNCGRTENARNLGG